MYYLKLSLKYLLVCGVLATFGFILILLQVHDYSQTRQAYYNYLISDGMLWVVAFYFLNESSSGIKYALTDNDDHLIYFPRGDSGVALEKAQRAFRKSLLGASNGDWKTQLRLSHLYALGWGTALDKNEAAKWYLQSEERAQQLYEYKEWLQDSSRINVLVFITSELLLERMAQNLATISRENMPPDEKINPLNAS